MGGYVLCQCHALASDRVGWLLHCQWQVFCYHLYCLQLVHVAHHPCALGDVALYGMCQCVHAGSSREALGQRVHQFGVDDGNGRYVVGVYAHHLCLALLVDDYIVDGDLRSGTCGCGHGYDGDALVLGRGATLKADHVGKLRVVGHYAYAFGRIHAGTSADGYQAVGPACLECLYALLHVGHGGVGLDLAVYLVWERCLVQDVGHHLGSPHFYQSLVATYQGLVQSHAFQYGRQFLARTCSEIRYLVENKSLCHSC